MITLTTSGSADRRPRGYTQRALALWPRLDRQRLRQAQDDPVRIARIVSARTALPVETILGMLGADPATARAARPARVRTRFHVLP